MEEVYIKVIHEPSGIEYMSVGPFKDIKSAESFLKDWDIKEAPEGIKAHIKVYKKDVILH